MSLRFAKDILQRMRDGDVSARAELIAWTPPDPPGELSRDERTILELIKEARAYALRGDLRESEFRLRLAAEPKWSPSAACELPYAQAMAEKRAREGAAA